MAESGSLIYCFRIGEVDMYCHYAFTISSYGTPQTRDDPGSPLEYDVELEALHIDIPDSPKLEVPEWLKLIIEQDILDSGSCYEDIQEAIS